MDGGGITRHIMNTDMLSDGALNNTFQNHISLIIAILNEVTFLSPMAGAVVAINPCSGAA